MKRIILQGITTDSHLCAIQRVLELDCPERVILSVAYMNSRGISLLREALKPVAETTTILAGIRNSVTSIQALEAVFELRCSIYTVDTGPQQRIFHPKIYMSRNAYEARLVIGSANLTGAGLRENIEASIVMDLKLDTPDDRELIVDLEKQIDGMIGNYPDNVIQISSASKIESLWVAGQVIDESEARNSITSDSRKRHELDNVPLMKPVPVEEFNDEVKVPAYIHFFVPLQAALRQLGGSGTNGEIYKRIVQIMQLSEEQLAVKEKGGSRTVVNNRIAHAKKQLGPRYHKYIEKTSEGGGGYRLTEKGLREDINNPDALMSTRIEMFEV